MEIEPVNHWYDYVFWAFMGGGALFILWIFFTMIRESIRDRREWRPVQRNAAPARNSATGVGSTSTGVETWGLGGTGMSSSDLSSGASAESASGDTGGSSDTGGGSDSGGGFESGGGDYGGGGSSGGWN